MVFRRTSRDRTLPYDKEDRPEFERMIFDLQKAKDQWDMPGLRDYSRVLLKLVGICAAADCGLPGIPIHVKEELVTSELPAQGMLEFPHPESTAHLWNTKRVVIS